MADRTKVFNADEFELTTTWSRVKVYDSYKGSYYDVLTGNVGADSEDVIFSISGLNLEGEERVKKAILSSTYSSSGTSDPGASFRINDKTYRKIYQIEPENIIDNSDLTIKFSLSASGNYGNVSGGGNAQASFSLTYKVSDITLTLTIGTGNAFDGKVSSLNEGDKIIIQEKDNLVPYTLVHHNYNDGMALILRDAPLKDTTTLEDITVAWRNTYDHGDTAFINSTLDNYLEEDWYPSLPAATQQFLQTIEYPVAKNYVQSPLQETIFRHACTVSAIEADGNGDSLYGTMLNYLETIICGSNYWTREHSYYSAGYKAKYIEANGGVYTYGASERYGVRPTLGLLEDQTVIYSESDGGYILCDKYIAPQNLYINGEATNVANLNANANLTLSWSVGNSGNSEGIIGYAVWYCESEDGDYELYGITESTSKVIVGPQKGYKTYYFKVQTLASEGDDPRNSDLSSVVRSVSTKESNVYYYDGASWRIATPKYYNGGWVVAKGTKYYDGAKWVAPDN